MGRAGGTGRTRQASPRIEAHRSVTICAARRPIFPDNPPRPTRSYGAPGPPPRRPPRRIPPGARADDPRAEPRPRLPDPPGRLVGRAAPPGPGGGLARRPGRPGLDPRRPPGRRADAIEARDADDPSLRRLRRDEAAERCLHQSLALLARGRSKPRPPWAVDPTPSPVEAVAAPPVAPRPSGPPLYYRIGNPEGDLPTSLPTTHLRCRGPARRRRIEVGLWQFGIRWAARRSRRARRIIDAAKQSRGWPGHLVVPVAQRQEKVRRVGLILASPSDQQPLAAPPPGQQVVPTTRDDHRAAGAAGYIGGRFASQHLSKLRSSLDDTAAQ